MVKRPSSPVLAEGMDRYVELFTASRSSGTRAAALLASDLSAQNFGWPYPPGMRVTTSFVVCEGHEIPVRIYHPGGDGALPALCYFHGGGFSMGSIESYDGLAAALSQMTGAIIVSVHYRRLPESNARAAQEDCYAALLWMFEHASLLGADVNRIGVVGDSAGAMLATITAMMARDRNGPKLCCQALLYGVLSLDRERAYYRTAKDPMLTVERVQSFIDLYNAAATNDPPAYPAPVLAPDLSNLPPAILVGAEYDPLLEETREYADRLAASGTAASLFVAPGMIHGFMRGVGVSAGARQEMAALARRLEPYLKSR
jgi:acetyl esterase